jgi:hypothetical protein
MRAKFAVTFEIVTAESAELGDAVERGFIAEGETLRDALALVAGPCEADSSLAPRVRWLTFYEFGSGSRREYERGEHESRSLHIPPSVTDASSRRIARLCGA